MLKGFLEMFPFYSLFYVFSSLHTLYDPFLCLIIVCPMYEDKQQSQECSANWLMYLRIFSQGCEISEMLTLTLLDLNVTYVYEVQVSGSANRRCCRFLQGWGRTVEKEKIKIKKKYIHFRLSSRALHHQVELPCSLETKWQTVRNFQCLLSTLECWQILTEFLDKFVLLRVWELLTLILSFRTSLSFCPHSPTDSLCINNDHICLQICALKPTSLNSGLILAFILGFSSGLLLVTKFVFSFNKT